jgi:two-component system chemotaxis response regulator CheY
MPKVTGLELLKMVRTDNDLWRVPFYLVSSLSEKRYIVNGINMGATGYMVKPVNQKMIVDSFKEYLT